MRRRVVINLRDSPPGCIAAAQGEDAVRHCSEDELVDEARDDGMTPLHVAALRGQLGSVQYLVRYSMLIDSMDAQGRTPLWLAAANGETDIVERLISAGADPTITNADGETPLHVAVLHGWSEVVEALIKEEPDLLTMKSRGPERTALHYAAAVMEELDKPEHALECLDLLLSEESTDPGACDADGRTALSVACEKGADEAVEELLHRAPDTLSMADLKGRTALHWAVLGKGAERVLPLLLKQRSDLVSVPDDSGLTPLHYAALNGNLEAVRALLRANASAKAKDKMGRTPLHAAATADQDGLLCEELLHATDVPPVDAVDLQGRTALHHASRTATISAINALLAARASAALLDHTGSTALYWAACTSSKACVKALLKAKADVHLANKMGWTPLHAAASADHDEQVDYLIRKAGADPFRIDKRGCTPLHVAAGRGHMESVERLLHACSKAPLLARQQDAKGRTAMHMAAKRDQTGVVQTLLEFGADPACVDHRNRTPLHYAIHASTSGPLEQLLSADAEVDAQDKRGRTALHLAAGLGHSALCNRLLEKGAARGVKDEAGRTPLHYAAYAGHTDATLSIVTDAEVRMQDKDAKTALHLAVRGSAAQRESAIFSVLAPLSAALPDRKGRTPVHYAAALNRTRLLDLLLQQAQRHEDSDEEVIIHEDEDDDIELMLPPSFAIADHKGHTPLHLAAASGAEEAMEVLVKAAPATLLNAEDGTRLKRTPLELAVIAASKRMPGAEDCANALLRCPATNLRPASALPEARLVSASLKESLLGGSSSPRTPRKGTPSPRKSPTQTNHRSRDLEEAQARMAVLKEKEKQRAKEQEEERARQAKEEERAKQQAEELRKEREAEAKRKAEEQVKLEAERKWKREEEERRKKEEAKLKADEDRARHEAAEAERKRKAEEEEERVRVDDERKRQEGEVKAKKKADNERRMLERKMAEEMLKTAEKEMEQSVEVNARLTHAKQAASEAESARRRAQERLHSLVLLHGTQVMGVAQRLDAHALSALHGNWWLHTHSAFALVLFALLITLFLRLLQD